MTYMFDIWRLLFSVRERDLERAAAKAGSCNGFGLRLGCVALACACARVDWMRGGLPRCAVACEAPVGRGNPVGFWRNCIQQLAIRNLTDSKRINDYLCVSPCTPRQTTPIDSNTL